MLRGDPSSPILIVVSTSNRKELTGICLDSIARNKHPWTQVVIIDDASTEYDRDWLALWGWPVHRRQRPIGVGRAARARIGFFCQVRTACRYLIAVDNDLEFADLFDLRLRSLWERLDPGIAILSGYRSVTYDVTSEAIDHVEVAHVGGACQFMDRSTAEYINAMVPDGLWSGAWDTEVAKLVNRRIVPKRSLVRHLGSHGTGHNGRSWDIAADFDDYRI